jgi:CubicO group peptidase (beta-lactamase class C family)
MRYAIGSISKQFTAVAALLLQQDGKLKLDDPVVKFLPELSASAHGVTLRHLLHHTGGLRDYIELLTMKERDDADGSTINEAVLALAGRRSRTRRRVSSSTTATPVFPARRRGCARKRPVVAEFRGSGSSRRSA